MGTYDNPKLAEIARLNRHLTELWALTDDLADVLSSFTADPNVERVLARYHHEKLLT